MPAPPTDNTVRIVPLGGLGEVGRNCNVLEYRGKLVVVDCGVLFPEESQPGVDLILPDIDYLKDRVKDIEAIVLTHGHEDHIGAVPYLLKLRPDIPVIGSQLTIAFIEAKLQEHRIRAHSHVVVEGDVEKVGPFEMEFIAVNHSIPDALAVFVRTAEGNILITGDFKMDQLPLDGRLTDLRAFAKAGEEGVDLFMCDSTNAEVPGFVRSESEIGPVIDDVFARATGKIVVASFSSHVHRVQQVLNAAARHGRKVAFVGRSMVRNMGLASELGYLEVPDGVLRDLGDMRDLPDNQRVYMSTGSQGEPMAVLARIANKSHPKISVGGGDTVLFASSLIPGNENSVYRLINGLMKLGAHVVHQGNAKVHVSGHAAQGELLYCYNILEPAYALPIHGEVRHQVANGGIAVKTGVPPENVILAENGSVIDMQDGEVSLVGSVPYHEIYVDGSSVGDITESELKDRRTLSEEGFIAIFAVVDQSEEQIITGPHIQARAMAEDQSVFDDILPEVTVALQEALEKGSDTYGMQQAMRRVVGRWASRKLRRSPMIIPTVVTV
ncbi:ribonuclease J [Ancrocorticia populi]|uniref:Ribonuclease J n=1 Tax=Ancrocorticia populi TaxID=2175228 RepID=A0A2V1K3I4_9ACTO|nr:ribonuclease J [Ancrocorticia populi]MDN6486305.1 ribonuclease J [Ancrocorticia sp.]PWF25784.1 RNase J family beta-CASP ribonuclease [Ancrocorticia populi]